MIYGMNFEMFGIIFEPYFVAICFNVCSLLSLVSLCHQQRALSMGFIRALPTNKAKLNVLSLLLGSIHFLVNQRILCIVQTKLSTSKRLVFILDF